MNKITPIIDEYVSALIEEARVDPVSLSHLYHGIAFLKKDVQTNLEDLQFSIKLLFEAGLIPVLGINDPPFWVHQTIYTGTSEESSLQIVQDIRNGKPIHDMPEGLWFAGPKFISK